jgi:glycosyltransferase involved in cell wall biosynthesis
MKFVFLHHGDPLRDGLWSGIPRHIILTLRDMGHEVVLIDRLKPESQFRYRVRTAVYRYLLGKIYVMNRDARILRSRTKEANRRLAKEADANAIIVTSPPDSAFVDPKVPVVIIHDATFYQLLDYYPGYERVSFCRETIEGGVRVDKRALSNSDAIIYSSQWAKASAVQDYGIQESKIHVIPFGANLKVAPTDEQVSSYLKSRGSRTMKLFFLGKEWYRKGGDVAVAVAQEIEDLGVPVELHVVGCKPNGAVPPFVKVYGLLDKEVTEEAELIWNLFRTSDYFILPTRADAFGIVFAEAAAFGLPIMTTDTGGVKEVMKEKWGIALPVDADPALYARWAVENFFDRQNYEQMVWNARKDYELRLNWQAFGKQLEEIVRSKIAV